MIEREIIQQVREETVWRAGINHRFELEEDGVVTKRASRMGFEHACSLELQLLMEWLPVADYLESRTKKRTGPERNGTLSDCNPGSTTNRDRYAEE